MATGEHERWGCFTAFRIGKDDLAALGALTIATQELDEFVATGIVGLLDAWADVDALIAHMQLRAKIEMLGALVLNRVGDDAALVAQWRFLEKRLHDARDDRNHFVHAVWEQLEWSDGEMTVIENFRAVRRRPRKQPVEKEADASILYELARKAEKLADDLAGFIFELMPLTSRGRFP